MSKRDWKLETRDSKIETGNWKLDFLMRGNDGPANALPSGEGAERENRGSFFEEQSHQIVENKGKCQKHDPNSCKLFGFIKIAYELGLILGIIRMLERALRVGVHGAGPTASATTRGQRMARLREERRERKTRDSFFRNKATKLLKTKENAKSPILTRGTYLESVW